MPRGESVRRPAIRPYPPSTPPPQQLLSSGDASKLAALPSSAIATADAAPTTRGGKSHALGATPKSRPQQQPSCGDASQLAADACDEWAWWDQVLARMATAVQWDQEAARACEAAHVASEAPGEEAVHAALMAAGWSLSASAAHLSKAAKVIAKAPDEAAAYAATATSWLARATHHAKAAASPQTQGDASQLAALQSSPITPAWKLRKLGAKPKPPPQKQPCCGDASQLDAVPSPTIAKCNGRDAWSATADACDVWKLAAQGIASADGWTDAVARMQFTTERAKILTTDEVAEYATVDAHIAMKAAAQKLTTAVDFPNTAAAYAASAAAWSAKAAYHAKTAAWNYADIAAESRGEPEAAWNYADIVALSLR